MTTTLAPHAIAAPLFLTLSTNDTLLQRALDGIAEADLWRRPLPNTNPMLWIAGHAVQTRAAALRVMGEPFDTGWADLFNRGAVLDDNGRYPSRDAVERVAREVGQRLLARIASFDEAQLMSPVEKPVGPGVRTLADQIGFFALHDCYHMGQLGYVRKALGYSQLVG
jgi:hypothetical protein